VGIIGAVQLRLKEVEEEEILRTAKHLLPLCHAQNVSFIMNDSPELAKQVQADGVHLGEDDFALKSARQQLGPEAVIGVSCYDSMHLAMEAGEGGADYVAFGSFYPSLTKEQPRRPDAQLLARWHVMANIPCVAIGGITPENAAPLIAHGADMLAVIGGVWQHPQGPLASVQAFQAVIEATEEKALSFAMADDV